jgi:glutathionylspermidine synthase
MPVWAIHLITWIANKLLLPVLWDLYKTRKARKEAERESREEAKKVEEYETKPSDSTFGDMP